MYKGKPEFMGTDSEQVNKAKKACIVFQILLLIWFFLDMTGVCFGDKYLVTQSYKEDGVFFLVYFISVILFVMKVQIGKWFITIVTSFWLATQFLGHEWYTIFGSGIMGSLEGKIKYFSGALRWMVIEGKYIPDIYHTMLHILILLTLISTIIYIKKTRKNKAASQ